MLIIITIIIIIIIIITTIPITRVIMIQKVILATMIKF